MRLVVMNGLEKLIPELEDRQALAGERKGRRRKLGSPHTF